VYSDFGQYPKALDYYQQALTIMRELGDKKGESADLNNLGVLYKTLGKYQKAKDAFQDSLTIRIAIGIGETWTSQSGLASVEAKLNQSDAAQQHYGQALDNIEKVRAGLIEKEHKLSFMQNKLHVYDEFIAFLQTRHQKQPKLGYDRQALEVFERKQGRVFLEEMGQSGALRFAGLPDELIQKEQSLAQEIVKTQKDLSQERAKSLLEQQNKVRIEDLAQRLTTLKNDQAALEARFQTEHPKYYALKYPKPVKLATLQNDVLQAGEVILVYGVMEESTTLWVIGKQDFQMFTLEESGEQQLQTEVYDDEYALRKVINPKSAAGDFFETSQTLYDKLIPKEVRQFLTGAKTLYIVPTGPLYGVPFEALVTEIEMTEDDEEIPNYLIEDYAIAYLSSASLLKILRDSQQEIKANQPLVAFADPVYPPCQEQKTAANDAEKLESTVSQLRTRAYLRAVEGGCFPRLPDTAIEAQAIAKLFKAPKESIYLREKAARHTVLNLNEAKKLKDYRYLLFATHGVLPDEVGGITQSALVLSNPLTEDGYLTMADAFTLELNADFINLSACNTGGGKTVKGEGIMGLTRAFMYAGTPAIGVTLWYVESQSAQELSIGIFENLKEGKNTAEALRQIKLKMITGKASDASYKYPYYWAPFVVYGDGQ
jgi:CHAT domain-containing protein